MEKKTEVLSRVQSSGLRGLLCLSVWFSVFDCEKGPSFFPWDPRLYTLGAPHSVAVR